MTTKGSYGHKAMVNFLGHPENVWFCKFLKILDGFKQNNSQGFLEFTKLYKQNPLEKYFIFTIYQNYTLALNK